MEIAIIGTVGMNGFSAIVIRDGEWWVGWVAEMPGVNAQEHDRDELLVSLREALFQALDRNRDDAFAIAPEDCNVLGIAPERAAPIESAP